MRARFPPWQAARRTNIWVANSGSNSVTMLLASTGATGGTFGVGSVPVAVAFDGANIWVANKASNSVSKIPAF
jgi:DNA-binding beta-propeller fold protein YncE